MAHQVSVTLLGPGLLDPGDAADLLDGIVPPAGSTAVIDALESAYLTRNRRCAASGGPVRAYPQPRRFGANLDVDIDEVRDNPVDAVIELVATTGAVVLCG